MDLRSGHPFWPIRDGLLACYPPLEADLACDIAIIGGGITGALIADRLAAEGLDTVLLDKRDIGTGSTAASTALLQYEIDTELLDLIGRVGEAHAVRAYRLGLEAIDEIERLTRELPDPCGFARRPNLYLASAPADVERLQSEFQSRLAHGLPVSFLHESEIAGRYPFSAPAAIYSTGDAEIDVYRFTHALLVRAARRGLRVYDRTEVTKFDWRPGRTLLRTDRGPTVSCREVVFATGYEQPSSLKENMSSLKSTYASISEPVETLPPWPDRCLIWETARPYFYLRTTDDGRILVGGEDTSFSTDHKRDRLVARKSARLEQRFRTMFPGIRFETAYAWAGTFAETKDGLAYIGRADERPASYALGYGGNGITMSVIAARLIGDLLTGRNNPDASIFRFDR